MTPLSYQQVSKSAKDTEVCPVTKKLFLTFACIIVSNWGLFTPSSRGILPTENQTRLETVPTLSQSRLSHLICDQEKSTQHNELKGVVNECVDDWGIYEPTEAPADSPNVGQLDGDTNYLLIDEYAHLEGMQTDSQPAFCRNTQLARLDQETQLNIFQMEVENEVARRDEQSDSLTYVNHEMQLRNQIDSLAQPKESSKNFEMKNSESHNDLTSDIVVATFINDSANSSLDKLAPFTIPSFNDIRKRIDTITSANGDVKEVGLTSSTTCLLTSCQHECKPDILDLQNKAPSHEKDIAESCSPNILKNDACVQTENLESISANSKFKFQVDSIHVAEMNSELQVTHIEFTPVIKTNQDSHPVFNSLKQSRKQNQLQLGYML